MKLIRVSAKCVECGLVGQYQFRTGGFMPRCSACDADVLIMVKSGGKIFPQVVKGTVAEDGTASTI